MPNIREYSAPEGLGLRPTDTGVDAVVAAARRTGAFFNQVGEVTTAVGNQFGRNLAESIRDIGDVAVKYEDHQQISHGTAAGTALAANLDQQWNKIAAAADPNDQSVRGRFLEQTVEPELEKFVGNFTTENSQRFANQFTANLRNHLWTKTAADMSTNGARAALSNASTTINSLGAMVRADPSSFDFAMTTLDDAAKNIATTSPTLDATKSAAVSDYLRSTGGKALTHAYLISVADKNPGAIPGIIESQKFAKYLSIDDTTTILNYAKTVGKVNESAAKHAREEAEYQAKQAFDRRATDLELATVPQNQTDRPNLPENYWKQVLELGKMPGADPSRIRALLHTGDVLAERLNKPEAAAKVSNATAVDLISRIRLPAGDPERITDLNPVYDAYGAGKLNKSDLKFVREEFANLRTPEGEALGRRQAEFIATVKPAILNANTVMEKLDKQSGPEQLYRFTVDLKRKINEYRQAGKDPYLLMDPNSPADYMGSPAALAAYQTTLQESLRRVKSFVGANTNQTAPGNRIVGVTVENAPAATSAPKPAPPPPPKKGEVRGAMNFSAAIRARQKAGERS